MGKKLECGKKLGYRETLVTPFLPRTLKVLRPSSFGLVGHKWRMGYNGARHSFHGGEGEFYMGDPA